MNEIQFILYQLPEEEGKVQVVIKDETIWCTQKVMSQLFEIDKSGISRHIANIFKEGELSKEATVAKIATVVNRGIRCESRKRIRDFQQDTTHHFRFRQGNQTTERRIAYALLDLFQEKSRPKS